MFPHPDTYAAVVKVERTERRALLREVAMRPRPARRLPARSAAVRMGWLARAVRSLRWALRPAHA